MVLAKARSSMTRALARLNQMSARNRLGLAGVPGLDLGGFGLSWLAGRGVYAPEICEEFRVILPEGPSL